MVQIMHVQGIYDADSRFTVQSGTGHTVVMDGDHLAGASPMEMLLASLAGCSGISVISILQKKREHVTHYEIAVHGKRAEEHPKVFEEIAVEHIVTGHGIRPQSIERAIELAETRYCGVSIMLGKATKLTHTYRILEAEQ